MHQRFSPDAFIGRLAETLKKINPKARQIIQP
jgi:hypothetical protein